jgi:hypothetical protein
MKIYTPVKKIRSQLSTHFSSTDEMEKFLQENPNYENGGVMFGYSGAKGVGVALNEIADIIIFANEFERFEFMQTNTEFEVDEAVIYNSKPAVWLRSKIN